MSKGDTESLYHNLRRHLEGLGFGEAARKHDHTLEALCALICIADKEAESEEDAGAIDPLQAQAFDSPLSYNLPQGQEDEPEKSGWDPVIEDEPDAKSVSLNTGRTSSKDPNEESPELIPIFAKTVDGKPMSEETARDLHAFINKRRSEPQPAASVFVFSAGALEEIAERLEIQPESLYQQLEFSASFIGTFAATHGRRGNMLHTLLKSRTGQEDYDEEVEPGDEAIMTLLLQNVEADVERARPRRAVKIGVVSVSDIAKSPGTRLDAGHYLGTDHD